MKLLLWSLLFALVMGSGWVRAVESYRPTTSEPLAESWRWRLIPELNGKGFRCMTEASDGSIWFGVTGGVMRYDGLKWDLHDADKGLDLDRAERICRAEDGSIYAASDTMLFRFSDGRWQNQMALAEQRNSRLGSLCSSNQGGVWAGMSAGLLHANAGKCVIYTSGALASELRTVFEPSTEVVSLPASLGFSEPFDVRDVHQDLSGDLWLLVNNEFIFRHRAGESMTDPGAWSKIPADEPLRILGVIGEKLWVIQKQFSQELHQYDLATGEWEHIDLERMGGEKFCEGLLQGRDGTLWVYGRRFLHAYRDGRWQVFEHPDRSEDYIRLIEASDGSLWTGKCYGRLHRIDRSPEPWLTYEGLNFQCESPTAKGGDGDAGVEWFLTVKGAVVRHQAEVWKSYGTADGLMTDPVVVNRTCGGHVCAAGSHHGQAATAWLDGDSWKLCLHPDMGWTIDFRATMGTPDGAMLLAGNNEPPSGHFGLIRAEPQEHGPPKFSTFGRTELFFGASGMAKDAGGVIWLAGPFLHTFDGQRISEGETGRLPASAWIDAMDSDPDGRIWLSAGGIGVFRVGGKDWTKFTTNEGLADMMSAALRCAPDGTVWAATPEGISRFDGTNWTPRVFGIGFPGFVRESGTLRLGGENQLWINYASRDWYFRANQGKAYDESSLPGFRAIRYQPQTTPPETRITMAIDRVSQPGNTILSWCGVSLWHATAPDTLVYSWRFGQGPWSPFSAETSRTFLNLPSGPHRFEVRARDQHFNIDPSPAQISFAVIAPLWRQPLFVLIMVVFAGTLAGVGYFLFRAHERHVVAQERSRAEIALMKLDLFTHLSHELRTPLTVIPLPIERAMAALEDGKLKTYLGVALKNVRELQFLVEQILDMRRLQEGKLRIIPTRMDLVKQTREVIESFQVLADHKQIRLHSETPSESLLVNFDPQALLRVLGNLISNAIKYTPSLGRVAVRLSVSRNSDSPAGSGYTACFEVEDSGTGISDEHLPHVFDPFYRGTANRTRGFRGAGVGLALTHELVARLGGKIQVLSPANQPPGGGSGTLFRVELPLEETKTCNELSR